MKKKNKSIQPESKIIRLKKDLAEKNQELKIEAALEKVRIKAMRMKKPDDMLGICKTISLQLESLGVKDIRNVQTAIFYPQLGTYMNYQYYSKHNKTVITETNYTNNKLHKEFAEKMLRGKGEFFKTHIKGKKVKNWIAYQKTTNVFIDNFLETATSLNYYWFSLGPVALGISTYHPLTEVEIILFKRFLKVFELAYRRYLDIEKAVKQAREVQIELALERVRARTMAMHKSNELKDVVRALYKEFRILVTDIDSVNIQLNLDSSKDIHFWASVEEDIYPELYHLPHSDLPIFEKLYNAFNSPGERFFDYLLNKEEKDAFFSGIFNILPVPPKRKKMIQNAEGMVMMGWFHKHSGIDIVRYDLKHFNEEEKDIVKRFASAFEQTYIRFLDLQKAEAQAREAEIELALERVRAKTMAMYSSQDVGDAVGTLFDEVKNLKTEATTCGITIIHNIGKLETWTVTSRTDNKIPGVKRQLHMGFLDISMHPFLLAIAEAFNNNQSDFSYDLEGESMKAFFKGINDATNYSGNFDMTDLPPKIFNKFFFFREGALFVESLEELSPVSSQIFTRFAAVFGQTYRRYLDLKKAESQARESQIQLALERVRARTMAMHKSEELSEVAALLFEQLTNLGIQHFASGFSIFDKNNQSAQMWWNISPKPFPVDFNASPVLKRVYNNWKEGKPFYINQTSGKEFIQHIEFLRNVFGERVDQFMASTRKKFTDAGKEMPDQMVMHHTFFTHGSLLLNNITPIKEQEILNRFARVFEQTYTRFLDLQKAEAQAREAEIQLALERVRARTMAMHRSSELADTAGVLFQQFVALGITPKRCFIGIIDRDKKNEEIYLTTNEGKVIPGTQSVPMYEQKYLKKIYNAWKNKEEHISNRLQGKERVDWTTYLMNKAKLPLPEYTPDKLNLNQVQNEPAVFNYFFFSNGHIGLHTVEDISEAEITMLKRFSSVFDQTYTRFLDLKKAEAQAREAQIEAALERVRSRTMAMHKSDELAETSTLIFEQFQLLGIIPQRCGFVIQKDDDDSMEIWGAVKNYKSYSSYKLGIIHSKDHPIFKLGMEEWRNGKEDFFYTLKGKSLKDYHKAISVSTNIPEDVAEKIIEETKVEYHFNAFFKHGSITTIFHQPPRNADRSVIRRFAKVLEQTYTRFLDLKKAEAQAREAQIEASLERVRSKAMAMHSPNDLSETVNVFFKELKTLGIIPIRCGVGQIDEATRTTSLTTTTSSQQGDSFQVIGKVKQTGHQVLDGIFDNWKLQKEYHPVLEGEDIKAYYNIMNSQIGYPEYPEGVTQYGNSFPFKEGFVFAWTEIKLSEEELQIFRRFTTVLSLTYRRYMDLKEAEAQAREAQIEAALERVRGKAMAMHNTEDFVATISAFYHELEQLSLTPRRCGVGIINKETRVAELSTLNTTGKGDKIEIIGNIKLEGHPVLENVFENWLIKNEYHTVLKGEEIKNYYQFIGPQIAIPDYSNDQVQYGYFFFFNEGGVYSWTEKKFSEDELQIYRRFTTVLSLTYRRYMDLKVAEVRAIEAVRQAALDRVRAEIASMRNSEDLNRITPIIWRELKTLEVPFIRCGVFIVDEIQEKVRVYLTTPDGKSLAALYLPFDSNDITSNTVNHWKNKQIYKEHWNKEDFINWTNSMVEIGQVQNAETYQGSSIPPESLDLHFVPFTQGMLYVGDVNPLTDEKLQLVKTLAEAFSIAYARYEDFKNLEEAKNKIENTLSDLRSAQSQLIHSEKMASLGELTAGIAHEIKNPLNFVNNFSEISGELLEEIKVELGKNDKEEVLSILEDLKQNLEKINQHGKRADSIVKGMLLHSRGTSGEKTLTDINDLLDQYVNLAYHGMRATNKEFNITIEKDYDESLEKINVVPQDISRVFLNIINNACYAAYDKKKKAGDDFSPVLKVSTKNLKDKVEIRIGDNGNGIPKDILDKVFQPFFTTKPTGEGTGLGLSLSYDIVTKVHKGELKVVTNEGEGTYFLILLPK